MENDIIRKGYDAMGEAYHQRRVSKQAVNYAYFDQLNQFWPASGEVLDLGCGGGVPVTKYFFERGLSVTGVDISPTMIAIAQKEIPTGNFLIGDMAELNFEEESFDLIVSTFAIIHVRREKHAALFTQLHSWLKPGGRAYLVLGEKDQAKLQKEWHGVEMYWSYFSPEKSKALLLEAGFRMVWEELEQMGNGEEFFHVILEK